MKKDCMFQYASKLDVYEDTGLITRDEAEELFEKYLEDIKHKWEQFYAPQMCIWINCNSETDYTTEEKDIDFRDCELINGKFYRIVKKLIY